VIIFRPHNVYGPNMGREHVIPTFALRMRELAVKTPTGPVPFPIQGTGKETRAFLHVEDCAEAVAILIERGAHLGIYHVGSEEERTIEQVAHAVAKVYGREISIVTGPEPAGATDRRCPDISRLRALGFAVKVPFETGLAATVAWYRDHGAYPEPP
jgi:dTDP-glucose 4,6-dehydratase/UDP-glucose 4-epimerase